MQITKIKNNTFQSFYNNKERYQENLTQQKNDEAKCDEFSKKNKALVAGVSLLGAIVPIVAINLIKGRGKNLVDVVKNNASTLKDKFKAGYKLFEIDDFAGIFASSAGAILAGGLSGIKNDPKNKNAKLKEGTFEFLNTMTPTCLVAAGEYISKKTGKFKSAPAKIAMIASSVAGGMLIANKTSNKLNEKVFDKDKENKTKRPFKLKDCLVHIDDILSIMILAKIPLAKTIQADKILPLLYTKTGYETGSAKEEK